MCQVGEYTFEITINRVNMVETEMRTTERVEIFVNLGWSQFAYLELRKTRSSFSIPLDSEGGLYIDHLRLSFNVVNTELMCKIGAKNTSMLV